MTNREILQTPKEMLREVDRQRQFLLRVESTPVPCPACKKPVNAFEAAGITLEEYDFGHTRYEYRCPACGAELEQAVPFLAAGGALWHWHFKDSWLQEQLRKAQEFNRQKERDVES
jgi:endogenous inhibitor of DNA gyrase (YacG/DUF329 family)